MILMVGDRAKFAKQRQPKKTTRSFIGMVFLFLGAVFFITILLWFVGVACWILAAIYYVAGARVKTEQINCPKCKSPNTIETQVQYFNCKQCNSTIRR